MNAAATEDDLRWLVTDAERWLHDLADKRLGEPRLVASLRRELSAVRASLVLEQAELRRRASKKFAAADRMFFTRQGLEQATDEATARYKASRYAGREQTADLCCGVGGDLLALAEQSTCRGIDRDLASSIFAAANLVANERTSSSVERTDVANLDLSSLGAWHIDPDRRAEGRRTTHIEAFEPGPDFLKWLLTVSPHGAIKLAPASVAPDAWHDTAELEWLGRAGECKQLVAWHGGLARRPGLRAATVIDDRGQSARTIYGLADEPIDVAPKIGTFVYEPHAAVLAAHLDGALAAEHGLSAVAAGVAYLTGDELIFDAALAGFRMLDVLPFDQKQLKAYARAHGVGLWEVKHRGVELSPEQLQRQLRAPGSETATLIVTPHAARTVALVCHRLTSSPAD